jgi:hypothetical protein
MINAAPNALYCPVCRKAAKKEQTAAYKSQTAEYRRNRDAAKKRAPVKKILLTDEEQLQINKAIDNKRNVDQTIKHYTPGHPDFTRLARQYGASA